MKSKIERLVERLRQQEEGFWQSIPASETSIATVERRLGVELPPSYRSFLAEYGAMAICDDSVSGIVDDDPGREVGGSVLSDTSAFRGEGSLPSSFVVISKHEDGAYCFDFSRRDSSGEVPVVNFELGSIQHEKPVSTSFAQWFFDFFLDGWIDDEGV